jgi:23S rRNA pseudouridine1911/1915/1917 synthase
MLHAWKLTFHHPKTGEQLSFEAPVPPDFTEATPK